MRAYKKWTALLLAVSLLLPSLPLAALAADDIEMPAETIEQQAEEMTAPEQVEETPEEEAPQTPENEAPADSEEPQPNDSMEEEPPEDPEHTNEEQPEAPEVPEQGPRNAPEHAGNLLPEDEPRPSIQVVETRTLQLRYDDRYSFQDILPDYSVVQIETEMVSSYQVTAGERSGTLDQSVLELDGTSDVDVIATGVGEATVLLAPTDQIEEAEEALDSDSETTGTGGNTYSISCVEVHVTVTPARLTVIFLTGQSNVEGACPALADYRPEDSVQCPIGQVYSTYLPSSPGLGAAISGINPMAVATEANVRSYVPSSLTGTENMAGGELSYPLYALTVEGKGKCGPDSGIAYEWNKLTGDKVWIINTAWGGSSISQWIPGALVYRRADAAYTLSLQTMNAEISAGHYTAGRRLMFWLQGEADKNMSADTYYNQFSQMKTEFERSLGVEYFGLITVRAAYDHKTEADLRMNGPRMAQYYIGSSADFDNVFIVSNVNEQWVTDKQVQAYFKGAYPTGRLTYPRHSGASGSGIPGTVNQIHPTVHYCQIGHNENGLTAAKGMYEVVAKAGSGQTPSVFWRDGDGQRITNLVMVTGTTEIVIPEIWLPYQAKQLQLVSTSSGLSYDQKTGTVQALQPGTYDINAENTAGQVIAALPIQVWQNAMPELNSCTNTGSGVQVTWDKVPGAVKYRVFRKLPNGWLPLGDTTGLTFTDTTAQSGTKYTYTVRCVSADGKAFTSAYDVIGTSITCNKAPVLRSVTNVNGSVQVIWDQFPGAVKYRVFRKTASTGWQALGDTTATSYIDSTAAYGITYIYTVRCVSTDGRAFTSEYDKAGKSITCLLATPALARVENMNGGVQIVWGKVTGAVKYRVFRKTAGTGWQALGDTTSLTYVDKTANRGTSVTRVNGGVQIVWGKVTGAAKYRVFRKTASTGWQALGDTTATSYIDSTAAYGITYIYTVRCVSADGRVFTSAYDAAGKSITIAYLATPALGGAEPVCLFIQEAILPNGFCACVIMKRCDII